MAGWVKLTWAFQVPEQFDYLELWYCHAGGMTVFLDDISIQRIASSGGSLILGAEDEGVVRGVEEATVLAVILVLEPFPGVQHDDPSSSVSGSSGSVL